MNADAKPANVCINCGTTETMEEPTSLLCEACDEANERGEIPGLQDRVNEILATRQVEQAAATKLLTVDYRCRDCGSPFLEYDGWTYANLPLNESEGIGRSWCGTCEVDGGGSTIDDTEQDAADRIAEWIAYRIENGLKTLEEDDAAFIKELQSQIDGLANRLDGSRGELLRLTGVPGPLYPCAFAGGWDIFNGDEIQRDDEKDLFESDEAALTHIRTCDDCLKKLGREALRVELVHLHLSEQEVADREQVGICPACKEIVYHDEPDGPVWTCPADLSPDNPFRQDPNPRITEELRERAGVFSNCAEDFDIKDAGGTCYEKLPLHSACYEKGEY